MSSTSPHHLLVLRLLAPLAAAATVVVVGAAPASARPDPGPRTGESVHPGGCLLRRVDTQLVRCDDLTGNGVAAPAFVRER